MLVEQQAKFLPQLTESRVSRFGAIGRGTESPNQPVKIKGLKMIECNGV
jgi:hypothetical protein